MPGYEIREYVTAEGRSPFDAWLRGLKDVRGRAWVRAQLDRVNLGDYAPVGAGVFELRLHFGPGYRVYFGMEAGANVSLLLGGTENTQRRDIFTAKVFWADYRKRRNGDQQAISRQPD